jgi:hypothetical protein
MQNLPLATRQPMDLALLMPGTSQDAARARKANSNIGAGAFTNGSALLVDGVWNKEGNTGEPRQDFPQSAIQEFKVYLSQSTAEYGWTAGGAVSMATKSGTNQLHGEGFEFYRNKSMNTIDPFAKAAGQAKPAFSRHQFGGAIGGAIIKDKVHFFQAAERLKNNLYDNVVVRQPQFYGNLNGVFPSPEYNNMTFSRGDWQISQKQNLFIRYAWQVSDFTCEGCGASSSTPWFSPGGGIKQPRYSWAGAHTWVLSPRVLNEVRGQWTTYLFRAHIPGVEPQDKLYDESPAAHGRHRRRSIRSRASRHGARTSISTATCLSRRSATTCRSRPASTRGNSAGASRACPFASRFARRRERGSSIRISRSIRRTSRRLCLFRDR